MVAEVRIDLGTQYVVFFFSSLIFGHFGSDRRIVESGVKGLLR